MRTPKSLFMVKFYCKKEWKHFSISELQHWSKSDNSHNHSEWQFKNIYSFSKDHYAKRITDQSTYTKMQKHKTKKKFATVQWKLFLKRTNTKDIKKRCLEPANEPFLRKEICTFSKKRYSYRLLVELNPTWLNNPISWTFPPSWLWNKNKSQQHTRQKIALQSQQGLTLGTQLLVV